MKHVSVVGSINIDITSYLDRWPSTGETVKARKTTLSLGGKGANQCVSVARFGCPVTMIGGVGTDNFGGDAEKTMKKHNVNLRLTRSAKAPTGMALIDVVPDGANIIRISAGTNALLSCNDMEERRDDISSATVLLLQNEIPLKTSLAAAKIARLAGTTVIMDPAPAPNPIWGKDVLSAFDIITPNAQETKLFLGHEPQNLEQAMSAAKALRNCGVRGAIVTMGGKGVAWSIDQYSGQREAPNVDAISTVAAGDCFNGVFAAAMVEEIGLEEAIELAVRAAAMSTTKIGAIDSLPTKSEVEAFY